MRGLVLAVFGCLVAGAAFAQGPRVEPGTPPSIPQAPPSIPGSSLDSAAPVAPPDLVMDLSAARVSITSAFQGQTLLLFGMFDPPGEVVVVVSGPSARETVLRKERFLGMWLNTGRQAFDEVPAYYYIAASAPLQRLLARGTGGEILSLEDRMTTVRSVGQRESSDLTRFRTGMIDVKRREGLFPADIGQVTIQANRLFRVDLPFPSRLPEGNYDVRAYLLREGKIVAAISRPLPVSKVGFNAQLAGWASHQGELYGLGAILMALLIGWIGGTVMRRL